MLEMLLQYEGELQNTALLGESADIILRRLYKAMAISHLWIWCEPGIGGLASTSTAELGLSIAEELESTLTLPPGSLRNTLQEPTGTDSERFAKMLKQAWRLPPSSSMGIVFCLTAVQLLHSSQTSTSEILKVIQQLQADGLPFIVVMVDHAETMLQPDYQFTQNFFRKVIHC